MDDVTDAATAILRCIDQSGEHYGRSTIVDILRGAETDRIHQFRLDQLLSYGALRHLSHDSVNAVLDRLLELEAIRTEMTESRIGQIPVLRLDNSADEILSGNVRVSMPVRQKKQQRKVEDVPQNVDRDLFARLSALRRKLSITRGVPPYVIFPDSTLRNLADKKPASLDEMSSISGIGYVKMREFGKIFLKEIQAYLTEDKSAES